VSRPESPVRERFEALAGPADGDWVDVTSRVKRRSRRVAALVAVGLVALVATGFGIGGNVIGLFDVHGKPIPLSSLSESDRELLVSSMCPHPEFRTAPGRAPQPACREGEPTIELIASDGSQAHYRIKYPWGLTCLATGRAGGYRDPTFGRSLIGSMGCNAWAPGLKLVPTPQRPITVDATMGSRAGQPSVMLLRVSGLAGEGISRVALVGPSHARLTTAVRGHAYSFPRIPARPWRAVAALDADGREVYRERLFGYRPPKALARPRHPRQPPPPPPMRPVGRPLQTATTSLASLVVYRNFAVLRFRATTTEAYARLARSAGNAHDHVTLSCLRVAYGESRWNNLGFGVNPPLGPVLKMRVGSSPLGGIPSPPYDLCQVGGMYGRYWNDEEGTHELVEVPLTPLGRRFVEERGVARDLAYFARTKKLLAIRRAINRGEPGPSTAELAQKFGERVVALASRNGAPPAGKIGVWTDGKLIVASELTPRGRRLFVTMRDVFIGATNIRGLAFVF
jgi:hypothetical protein